MLSRLLQKLRWKRSGDNCPHGAGASVSPGSRRFLQGERGFTMVELLVSIFVMTIAIFAVIGMQMMAFKANTVANQLSIGSALAQQVLEDIMSFPLDNRTINTTNTSTSAPYVYGANNFTGTQDGGFLVPGSSPPTYSSTSTVPSGGVYSATYNTLVGTSSNGIPTGVTRITVTIIYSYKGTNKSVVMTGFKRTV